MLFTLLTILVILMNYLTFDDFHQILMPCIEVNQ